MCHCYPRENVDLQRAAEGDDLSRVTIALCDEIARTIFPV